MEKKPHECGFSPPRRRVMRAIGAVAGAAITGELLSLAGCTPRGTSDDRWGLEVPLSELPPGSRVTRIDGITPIEIHRTAEGFEVKSLMCTHFGCRVRWVEEESIYKCPCHDGRYDPAGRVISGPPIGPLMTLPHEVSGEKLRIGRIGKS